MTQIESARRGIVTPEVSEAAAAERLAADALRERIAAGRAVLPANARRDALGLPRVTPCAIGEGLRTKVNANIGASTDFPDLDAELAKLRAAVESGADTVMDLSTGGDLVAIRRKVLESCPVPVGTVPLYDVAVGCMRETGAIPRVSSAAMLDAVRRHAEQGVDFVTVHCGITRAALACLERSPRVCGVVSRGGSFLTAWMTLRGEENPLYEQFDEVLAICRACDVTLSLGDALRPGALADAFDRAQVHELNTLAELTQRAREAGVQTIVEGPGHVPISQVAAQVKLQKELCRGAPFYVLGPLVTDVAPGYDHITSAIGGAVAAAAGVDFICYVTPTEHLGLPAEEHVREGVIAARIAAHAGDLAKGVPGAAEWDLEFSRLRQARDWEGQLRRCMDPRRARALRHERRAAHQEVCSMCGDLCVFKISDDVKARARKPG